MRMERKNLFKMMIILALAISSTALSYLSYMYIMFNESIKNTLIYAYMIYLAPVIVILLALYDQYSRRDWWGIVSIILMITIILLEYFISS